MKLDKWIDGMVEIMRVLSFSSSSSSSVLPRNFIRGQCPRALEKVGTFEKKVGTLWGKWCASDLEVKNQFVIGLHHY